jgi:hypothetical protein
VSLLELVQNNATLSTEIQDEVRDSLTHFYVVDRVHSHVISNANIILMNDQGEIVDAIQTNNKGFASYPIEELEKHRIHEIRIIADEQYEETSIIWTPDGDQQLIITLNSTEEHEQEPQIFLGYVVRP